MPRRSRVESEQTRRRILDVAQRLYTEHGYAHVGLELVASAAEVSRGAVYHHFAGKRLLFESVLAEVQGQVAAQVEAAAARVGDGWEGIRAGSRAFLDAATDDSVRQIMLIDAPAVLGWQRWRDLDAEYAGALLRQGLRDLAQQGGIDGRLEPDAAATVLSGALNESAMWLAAPDRSSTDRARIVDLLDDVITAMSRGGPDRAHH